MTQELVIKKKDYPLLVNYRALAGNLENVGTIVQENLKGQVITPFSLDRIKIPAGGGTSWEIPDLLEDTISIKAFHGLILNFTHGRSFWEHGLDEGGLAGPPNCISVDLDVGHGSPGGPCATCPKNEWESGRQGRGKACREKMMLFLLMENTFIPRVIQVPTTSIKVVRSFMLRLASEGIPFYSIIPEFTLKQVQQAGGGLNYSQMVITIKKGEDGKAEMLNVAEVERLKELREQLSPILEAQYQSAQEADDYLNDND